MLVAGLAAVGFAGLTFVTRKTRGGAHRAWLREDEYNSSGPPSTVPAFITVIVSSSITQSGSMIAGDIPKLAIVQINPGYASSPGQDDNGNGSRGNMSATVSIQCQDAFSFCEGLRWFFSML